MAITQIPVPALTWVFGLIIAILNMILLHKYPDTSMIVNSSYLGASLLTRCLTQLLPIWSPYSSFPFPNPFTSPALLASGAIDSLPWSFYVFWVFGVLGCTGLSTFW